MRIEGREREFVSNRTMRRIKQLPGLVRIRNENCVKETVVVACSRLDATSTF
jgi:hypothetical protein